MITLLVQLLAIVRFVVPRIVTRTVGYSRALTAFTVVRVTSEYLAGTRAGMAGQSRTRGSDAALRSLPEPDSWPGCLAVPLGDHLRRPRRRRAASPCEQAG